MPTNNSNIRSLRSKTLIIIVGILVALMISINSGFLKLSQAETDHKNIPTHIIELFAAKEKPDNNKPSFLQLSQDLHNLYKKVRN